MSCSCLTKQQQEEEEWRKIEQTARPDPAKCKSARSFQTSSSLKVVLLHLLRTTAHFLNTQIPTSSDHSVLVSQLTYCLVVNHGYRKENRRKKKTEENTQNNNDKKYTQQQSPSSSNTTRSPNKKSPISKHQEQCSVLVDRSKSTSPFFLSHSCFPKKHKKLPPPCTS